MLWRFIVILIVTAMLVLAVISCNHDPLVNTAYGGAILLTASEVDEDMKVNVPETTFKANTDFYFHFDNNSAFEADSITVNLVNSKTGRVLAETDYPVKPESAVITDMIWFSAPGRYKITVIVNNEVRAVREVIIE